MGLIFSYEDLKYIIEYIIDSRDVLYDEYFADHEDAPSDEEMENFETDLRDKAIMSLQRYKQAKKQNG